MVTHCFLDCGRYIQIGTLPTILNTDSVEGGPFNSLAVLAVETITRQNWMVEDGFSRVPLLPVKLLNRSDFGEDLVGVSVEKQIPNVSKCLIWGSRV